MKAAIVLVLLGWLALAALPTAAAEPERYDVEVLVFEIRAPNLEGSELWTRLEQPIDASEAVSNDDMPASETFAAAAEKLRADERFRVLLQERWVQANEPRADADAVLVRTWDNEIDGTVKIYVNRFMHVVVNLMFRPSTMAIGADAAPAYVIREERRVRSNQINYFDHPKFGVLVRVVPVKG